jgi:hypothetical protein
MSKMDKKSIVPGLLILGLFCGCAGSPLVCKQESSKIESSINGRDFRIRELEALLAEKQAQIQEKDKQVEQLKEKLRSLGVF